MQVLTWSSVFPGNFCTFLVEIGYALMLTKSDAFGMSGILHCYNLYKYILKRRGTN